MAIQLSDPKPPALPVLRHQMIGEIAQLAIVKYEQRFKMKQNQNGDYEKIPNGTQPNGEPKYKQELVVTGIVMPGTTMEISEGDKFRTPAPGEKVRYFISGLTFKKWIDAKKAHRGGNLNVGDILITGTDEAQPYNAAGKPHGQAIRDRDAALKLPPKQTVGYYGPIELAEPTDPQWVTAAEEAYLADQRAEQEARAIPADATPAASRSWLDEEDMPY